MQSGFSATRESPHTHFPPSPNAPIRSNSCGQLKAGGKKSPATVLISQAWLEKYLHIQAVYAGQGSLSGGNLVGAFVSFSPCSYSRAQLNSHNYVAWCGTKLSYKALPIVQDFVVLTVRPFHPGWKVWVTIFHCSWRRRNEWLWGLVWT